MGQKKERKLRDGKQLEKLEREREKYGKGERGGERKGLREKENERENEREMKEKKGLKRE